LGENLAGERVEDLPNDGLAAALQERYAHVRTWRRVYHDDFIPFAHGVRQLGIYYNDAVHPEDPYEFVQLLRGQEMRASRRNRAVADLARLLTGSPGLHDFLEQLAPSAGSDWWAQLESARALAGGNEFLGRFRDLLGEYMDVALDDERLIDRPELLLKAILKMARDTSKERLAILGAMVRSTAAADLEQRLLDAVGSHRREEAAEVLAIGRLSWRLRDDDNLLLGRVESQLLRAVSVAAGRLRAAGRLADKWVPDVESAPHLAQALRNPCYQLPAPTERTATPADVGSEWGSPRQLVGQPAAQGLATGRVRRVVGVSGMADFTVGEVMVCDAIQPAMTHLVPLAGAIVERRGGMLIHGAIIARELAIPCVNGVENAVALLRDGEIVTVDGYLGIVTVGPPEFHVEGVDEDDALRLREVGGGTDQWAAGGAPRG
jgi:pyruvate,water dikinase